MPLSKIRKDLKVDQRVLDFVEESRKPLMTFNQGRYMNKFVLRTLIYQESAKWFREGKTGGGISWRTKMTV